MEKMGDWEQMSLINELTQGRELTMQLQLLLNVHSSSQETRELLVQKILGSYEKALSIINCNNSAMAAEQALQQGTAAAAAISARAVDSPPSLTGSPRSEDSDREFKEQELKDMSKRRKTLPTWTQLVRVTPGTALEGSLDDGFSWRKYGQKDILGARYPRGYYRCTHRNVQGCLATKHVQRSDDDPTIFEITYRGSHTCIQASHMQQSPLAAAPKIQEQNTNTDPRQPEQNQQQSLELLQSFQRGLKVVTEDLDIREQKSYPLLPFPSSSNSRPENNYFSVMNNQVIGEFSSFISPAASGTTGYNFSVSPNGVGAVQGSMNFQSSDQSEINHEIISATSSAANSSVVGLEFPFGSVEFDPNFTFDHPGFFS